MRTVPNGMLVQDRDKKKADMNALMVVSKRQPSKEELDVMLFGWRVVKHVKSNAIV